MGIPVVLIITAALGLGCLALGLGIFVIRVDTPGNFRIGPHDHTG